MPDPLSQLADRAANLRRVTDTDGWQQLRDDFERKREQHVKMAVTKWVAGQEPVDQRLVDYMRGFWDGAEWILDDPARAAASLEAGLRAEKKRQDREGTS